MSPANPEFFHVDYMTYKAQTSINFVANNLLQNMITTTLARLVSVTDPGLQLGYSQATSILTACVQFTAYGHFSVLPRKYRS